MELARVDLSGAPAQVLAEDGGSPMGRFGLLGVDIAARHLDGRDQTVVQILLDDDRPGFDRTLLDAPVVAELAGTDGVVVAREPFDHDAFRRRLQAEQASGESVTRGVLVLTDGELPPAWVRLAFLPVPITATADLVLRIARTTVTELIEGVDQAYARGEVTDQERQAVIVTISQRYPDAT